MPKWQVVQNSSSSDSFNAISGFTSNSRAPGGPVTTMFLIFNLLITLKLPIWPHSLDQMTNMEVSMKELIR